MHMYQLGCTMQEAHKTKHRARGREQRHQWFNGWGSLHVQCRVLEEHSTESCRRWTGHGGSLRSGAGSRAGYQLYVNQCQVSSSLSWETRRGTQSIIVAAVRLVISWGLEKVRKRLVRWVGYRWRHWGIQRARKSHLEWLDHTLSIRKMWVDNIYNPEASHSWSFQGGFLFLCFLLIITWNLKGRLLENGCAATAASFARFETR